MMCKHRALWGLLFAANFLLVTIQAGAQTYYYVRAGATSGAKTGADWSNAYTSLPSTLVRGAVYYVADGSYPSHAFRDAESGTTLITVRKATPADHGPGAGWSDSYGVGQAMFTAPFYFQKGYYLIDGAYRSGWTSGYGFKLNNNPAVTDTAVVFLGDTTPTTSKNVTIRYMEIEGSHSVNDAVNDSGVVFARGSHNCSISYCYIHNVGLCSFFMRGVTNSLIEHSFISRNDSSSALHAEGVSASEGVNNFTVRYNIWEDMEGTAFIATPSGNSYAGGNAIANWYIYGNVFRYSPGNAGLPSAQIRGGVGDGILAVFDIKVTGDLFFLNNTMVNVRDAAVCSSGCWTVADIEFGIGTTTTADRFYIKNNLWVNCTGLNALGSSGITDFQWKHNAYCGTTISDSDSNKQIISSNPLTDWANNNYRLTVNTAAGTPLPAPFDTDPDGRQRTTWSRGAYEFGGADTTAPTISAVSATSITTLAAIINWTTSESTTGSVQLGTTTSYGTTVAEANLTTTHAKAVTGLQSGTLYHYRIVATDSAGNSSTSGDYTFTTGTPDTTGPTVSVTAPSTGAVVSNTVTLTASATDSGSGMSNVIFLVDGSSVGTDSSSPFSVTWNSQSAANGSHTVTARATDAAGQPVHFQQRDGDGAESGPGHHSTDGEPDGPGGQCRGFQHSDVECHCQRHRRFRRGQRDLPGGRFVRGLGDHLALQHQLEQRVPGQRFAHGRRAGPGRRGQPDHDRQPHHHGAECHAEPDRGRLAVR